MQTRTAALEISPALLADLETHARGTYPDECCGMLVGIAGNPDSRMGAKVTAIWPAENAVPGDRSKGYAIAPEELLQAYNRARSRGDVVIGYYHSHPDSGAAPSDRDLAAAAPGVSYLIVSIRDRVVLECRSWRLRPDNSGFEEESLI